MTAATVLLLLAFILFVLGTFGASRLRMDVVAGGLACLTLSLILDSRLFG